MRRLQSQVIYDEPLVSQDHTQVAGDAYSAEFLLFPGLPVDSWRYRYVKRAIDIALATLMGLMLLIPGLLIALCIYLTTPYPVFYSEKRIGRGGVPFRIWKFRSMRPHKTSNRVVNADADRIVLHMRMNKNGDDPRVTPVGRFLRRWSLDELPQLYNVLRGEMSLIGPRPVIKAETHFYKHLLPYYLAATPGLSGLWQVSGRSDLDYDERAGLDARYVETWSLRSDLRILLKTVPVVLARVGAR